MWRSVFLHELRNRRISDFGSLEGAVTPATRTIVPTVESSVGGHVIDYPGSGAAGGMPAPFEFSLTSAIPEVVGISIRTRVRFPRVSQRVADFQITAGITLALMTQLQLGQGFRAVARIDGQTVDLGQLQRGGTGSDYTDVRLDWHASGQLRLVVDGQLVAYRNGVAPGSQFTIAGVAFSGRSQEPFIASPRFRVGRVFVRALTRRDPIAHFEHQLPPVKPVSDDLVDKCRIIATDRMLESLDRLRVFMASAHEVLSHPWNEADGPVPGPFEPAAVQAHGLATAAATNLMAMLSRGDFAKPERFLDPFGKFLRILRDARPTEFAALAADLAGASVVPAECRAALEAHFAAQKDALAPLLDLLTSAAERVSVIAEGN